MRIVLFGDVVASQLAGAAAARWLRGFAGELDEAYGAFRCARFGFTQGDELQGVLIAEADPFQAVLRAVLRDEKATPSIRWAIAVGEVDAGDGPATQWTGPAFVAARQLIEVARRQRVRIVVQSGDPRADALLDDIAPVLGTLLAGLTDRQRLIGKLLVVDHLRQADAAERLAIARPTVSVAAERAHIRDIAGLSRASLALLREGIAAAGGRP